MEPRTDRFFDYWRARADFIQRLLPDERHHHEVRVLTFAALDSLANLYACALGSEPTSHARRFGTYLLACGDSRDIFDRVSLPFFWWRAEAVLQGRLKGTMTPKDVESVVGSVRQFGARQPPTEMSERALRHYRNDPTLEEARSGLHGLLAALPAKAREQCEQLLLDSRFGEIAYSQYRCSWIHEGRPGKATHSFLLSDEEPTYLGNLAVPPRIGFSPRFMLGVLRTSLDGFHAQALERQLDPIPPSHWEVIALSDDDHQDNG